MFESIIAALGGWAWAVLGLLLAAVELVFPGAFFIWFAVAAMVVAVLTLAFDIGWQAQALLFVVLAIAAVFAGRRIYGHLGRTPSADGLLNDRTARQIGRIGRLEEGISSGLGRLRLDDTIWRVTGPDLPAGTQVKVVAVRDGRLAVEAVGEVGG
ncbi:NfeD family protein [Methylobrevis sp. L22]|uniref:NfeD family protein n=1 Tax=Methylobrevis albus TaxID=2793297 RepID=A0A931N0T3_9HYPH|nr:NfeD family protein [Methylobrevis albus]